VGDGKLLGVNQPDQLDEPEAWAAVASSLGHLDLTAFEAKALYVFGLIPPARRRFNCSSGFARLGGIRSVGRRY
jgi:hypothetical protein